jgi:hydroxymethylbilane synthase
VSPELPILGYSRREDPRDVLVLPAGTDTWDKSLPVGTASKRRELQLLRMYPGLEVKPVRGNVATRLEKLDQGQYGALILAAAGLKRLGYEDRISNYFEPEELLPAGGQGILALQGRAGEHWECLEDFFDRNSRIMAEAERGFLRELEGGCSAPVAAYAQVEEERLLLWGFADTYDGSFASERASGTIFQAEQIGIGLARYMRDGL